MGKSADVDNIPAEFVQAGGEVMTDILTSFYNKIWKTGEWPTTWTQSLVITIPKKSNFHSAVYILFWSFEISDNILRNQK